MKRLFLLFVFFPCLLFSQPFGQGKQVIVTSDTVNINKTDRYTYFYTVDNLFYFSNNGILKQIATANDSISLANVYVDTLKGRLQDSIFIADDLVALYDILFEGTTSNKMYFEDTDGDTVIVIDPNMSGNPSIYMMDGTAADSVRIYHDGTNLKIVPDAGTTKIDIDGTLEADSLNAGGSTDYVGIGNATTGMINVVAASAGDYTVLKVSGAGINNASDYIIYIGVYDNWKGSGKLSATQLETLQDVTINRSLFVDDSLDVDGVLQVSPVVDSVAINGKLYVSGTASLGTISADSLNLRELTVTDSAYIDTTTTAVLRVTGKSVVEDSIRVDKTSRFVGAATFGATATPVVIGANAKIGIGLSVPATKLDQGQFSADALGSYHTFSKSRHATAGSHTIVQDNDVIGGINFAPSDGTDFGTVSAQIKAEVDDAAPAASSIGGALVFSTAAGAASDDLTERMRIDALGSVGINNATGYRMKTFAGTSINLLYLGTDDIAQIGSGASAGLYLRSGSGNIVFFGGATGQTEIAKFTNAGNLGIGTTAPASNSLTLGTKATQRDLVVTRENTPAGTDSSAKLWVDDGDGKLGLRAGDADSLILTCANDSARIKSNNPIVLESSKVMASGLLGNRNQQTTTLGVGATTFAVTKNVLTITGDGAGNTIGTITGAVPGIYVFIFVDANVTVTDTDVAAANTIDLAGTATNLTSADDLTLTLVFDGTSWFETARSAN